MPSPIIKDAQFIASATTLNALPAHVHPEIAIVGRSNVGKSTLLNRLLNRRKLANVSATPGRTAELNAYSVKLVGSDIEKTLHLVDLPGFGFARFSKEKREELSKLTVDYLSRRKQLKVVCLLNDCRRLPERDELAVLDLCAQAGRDLILVATKIDQLNQSEKISKPNSLAKAYHLDVKDIVLAGVDHPIEELWERILRSTN